MDLNARSVFASLKQNGLKLTIASFFSAIVLGVVDQFGSHIVPSIADYIRDWHHPPVFYVRFSPPIDTSAGFTVSLLNAEQTSEVSVQPTKKSPQIFAAASGPGTYLLQLRGSGAKVGKELVVPKKIERSGESWDVDTSDRNWANANELKSAVAPNSSGSPPPPSSGNNRLSNTRWAITEQDYAVLFQIDDKVLRSVLATALNEIGIFEKGNDWEKRHIAAYWQAAGPEWASAQQQNIPWGGAFLAWIVTQNYLVPPAQPASYMSWRQWNREIPLAEARPGLIGVFQLNNSEVPQSRSRLLVGPIVRRTQNCTEAIIGNISDRVVITCIANELLVNLRHPGQA